MEDKLCRFCGKKAEGYVGWGDFHACVECLFENPQLDRLYQIKILGGIKDDTRDNKTTSKSANGFGLLGNERISNSYKS